MVMKCAAGLDVHVDRTASRLMAPWTVSGTTRVSWYQKGKIRKVKPVWIYWSKI